MQQINMTQLRKLNSRKPGAGASYDAHIAQEHRIANYLSCVRKQINNFVKTTPRKANFNWIPGKTV